MTMRRSLLNLFFVVAGFAAGHYGMKAYLHRTKTPRAAGYDVLIKVADGHGSGVHIGRGYYLTAAHVVTDNPRVTVQTDRGASFDADVLWASKEYDVALIHGSDKSAPVDYARLSCRKPKRGQTVYAEGNPTILKFIRVSGAIASEAAEKLGSWGSAWVVSMPVIPGMSGGGAFDSAGDVIGIVVGAMLTPVVSQAPGASVTGLGVMVPSSTICKLMARA